MLWNHPHDCLRLCDAISIESGIPGTEETEKLFMHVRERIRKAREEIEYGWPHGYTGIAGRVEDYGAMLAQAGWPGPLDGFRDLLMLTHSEMHPTWSSDALRKRPREAIRYCGRVAMSAYIPATETFEYLCLALRERIRKDGSEWRRYRWRTQRPCGA
jgi:hypothetical protein